MSSSVARMICPESRMARGNATRRMLRTAGMPPTVRVASSGGAGGLNTKLSKPGLNGERD